MQTIPRIAISHLPKRYAELCERTGEKFLIIQRFDATDGNPDILQASSFKTIHSTMTDGAVGCMLSHIEAWKYIRDLPCRFAMLAEDDWIPPPQWTKHLHEIIAKVPDDVDIVMLTHPSSSIWCDNRSVAVGQTIKVNSTYILRECLPCFSTGCMAITPRGASKLLLNLGSTHLVPSDILTSISVATLEQLRDASSVMGLDVKGGIDPTDPYFIISESTLHIRQNPNFSQIKAYTVQRPKKYDLLCNGKYHISQFGTTPININSSTEVKRFNIRDHMQRQSV